MIFERPSNITGQLGHDNFELYFESDDLDAAETRFSEFGVPFVHALREQPWSQRVFRIYDPDEHIVELGELMPAVMLRFLGEEMSSEQIAERTFLPLDIIRQIADGEASHRCIDCSKKHM